MEKVIAFVRVSTEVQEMEAQKAEIIKYIKADGYKEKDIIIIEYQGASAIKVDEMYQDMIDKLKAAITTNPNIKACYLWSLDRLGRRDDLLMSLKNFFIGHRVNLILLNPTLRLLNEDGSLNTGAEVAYALLAVFAKQEMETKKERFRRSKERNKAIGKYNGGIIQYGFSVNEKGYFVVDEKEADVIRLVYDLYLNGYSTYTLRDELKARGIKTRNGSYFRQGYVSKILNFHEYVDAGIITQETYDKADKIKAENLNKPTPHNRPTKRDYLLNRLITCPCCGMHFVAKATCYICVGNKISGCVNNVSLDITTVDSIVWYVAKEQEKLIRLNTDNSKTLADAQERLSVALQKIDVCKSSLAKLEGNRERILELYMNGDISREKKDDSIAKTSAKADTLNTEIATLEREIDNTRKLIDDLNHPNLDFFYKISKGVELETERKKEIIRKNIADVRFGEWHNTPNKCIEILVKSVTGEEHCFRYFPHRNKFGYKVEYKTKDGFRSMMSL